MKVLVTGATGILGGWLTQTLVRRGDKVACLVRDEVPDSNFVKLGLDRQVTTVRGSLESYEDVARAVNEYEAELVYHLAAQAIVTVGNRDPLSTFEANIKGSWNVLEVCRRHKPLKRLLFASSDKAYGDLETLPYTEEMPLRGSHPYDASKSCADLLAQSYLHTYKLPVAIVRCGNLYGGGDLNFNRIIPGTIQSVLHRKPPIIRSDGTPLRDYLYVDDAVSAYLALADSEEVGAFNFGTETPTAVIELVRLILQLMKSSLQPAVENKAPNEIAQQWLSCAKARKQLGWKPKFDLKRGLAATIAWYRKNSG
ncbi:MAG TPA: NAD-dependent epimerase/dehydratase family protein [Planctomycetota bacterium]|nr:NAD-dependent epimerase/dehydratase family protein [Planctomycetota bacterium]